MTTSAPSISRSSWAAVARVAPWWTTTRRPGVNLAASAAQLPTTAGGAMTSAVPRSVVRAMWASMVGPQLALEALGARDRVGGGRLGLLQQVGGPAAARNLHAPGQAGPLEAD